MKQFKIAVVMPVYNAEVYLCEAIDSVINQSIGFKKNVQLILVNDGSSDNSGSICESYQNRYPDNVIYVKQENAGVSAARNKGLSCANAEYITFFDSDDKWDKYAFKKGVGILDENLDLDVVAFRMKYFEASDKYHMLDYKFEKGNRVINIMEEPECIVIHCNSTIIRMDSIGTLRFDTRLCISEDTKFLYNIILEKEKYYVVADCLYNYRKRNDGNSAIQTSKQKPYYYLDTIKYAHKELIDYSNNKYGSVIKYVQYFLAYELQWRIKRSVGDILLEEDKKEYINLLEKIVGVIDNDVIAFQRNIGTTWKFMFLKIKYGYSLEERLSIENGFICVDGREFLPVTKFLNHITELEIDRGMLHIIGEIQFPCKLEVLYKTDDEFCNISTYPMKDKVFFEGKRIERQGYNIRIDISHVDEISFYIKYKDKLCMIRNSSAHYSRLNNKKGHYYCESGFLLKWKNKRRTLHVTHKPTFKQRTKRELRYIYYLIKNKKFKNAFYRVAAKIFKCFNKKEIWLFADREFMGRDNAEALFKYAVRQPEMNNFKLYFIVNRDTEDFKRIKRIGNVVGYHTFKYEMLFLNADYLISSHADGYVNNAFGKDRTWLIDLYRFKYIYLTHGILLHDSSGWLNRVNKNFALNVVTSPYEYESITNGYYYFERGQLIKTGMPRLDNLFDNDVKVENKILFMPSWRSSLVSNSIPNTQRREYNTIFKESEYYCFYKRLLSDLRLLRVLEANELKIKFCIHPSFRAQMEDFKLLENDYVEMAIDVDSQYEAKSSLGLVTDYSSAACDFAYLKKPVVYANFDLDHIYDVHYYNKGYFDYDIHGFGPNGKNYEEIINYIINMVESDFTVEDKYRKRMDDFFYYIDNNNTKRTYEEIVSYRNQMNIV